MDTSKYQLKLEELTKIKDQRVLTQEEDDIYTRLNSFLQADRLGLKYFVYQGGLIPDTLSFCKERDNKVFSIDEMMSWNNCEDKPTNENWDPIMHLGGNMCSKDQDLCRHSLDFISFSLAKRYRPEIEK